jgi:hypothetical protein
LELGYPVWVLSHKIDRIDLRFRFSLKLGRDYSAVFLFSRLPRKNQYIIVLAVLFLYYNQGLPCAFVEEAAFVF